MRDRGIAIEVASINLPDRPKDRLPKVEAAEAEKTFYVKPDSAAKALTRLFMIAFRNPLVLFRGLGFALAMGGWDLLARAYALFYLAEALLVGDWMRRRGLSHLHVHFGGAVATVGMITAHAWRIPWSLTLHGPDEFFDQEKFYLRQKIESTAFVICISDFCRSQVIRIAPQIDDSRTEIVRLGVDCDQLKPLEHFLKADEPREIRFVCTGRLVAAKGHRIFIESLSRLAQNGVYYSVVLIGDGPERAALQSLINDRGIADRVQFAGAMDHGSTLDEVAKADVFVLASFAEGLPVALMEAMALGIPCVSTTIAAIPELIGDGSNGRLVFPANVDALSDALQNLTENPDFRALLGREARHTIEKEYNLNANLEKLAAVWRRRLGGRI
ncbi:glycosyltransferase family 4 protein [Acidicapsa dinghuensis]|uniref:Glycosyltransferase family 4 protein n=1 Tax=Acidicapsa dinghuensis TaxID=2218256 RepID=A0ABW1EDD5_9BACT